MLCGCAAGTAVAVGVTELAGDRSGGGGGPRPAARPPNGSRAVRALIRLGRRVGGPAPRQDLAQRIEAAGAPLGLGVRDLAALKGAGAAVALIAGAPLAASLPGRLPVAALIALPLAGFLMPDLLLARRARARGRAMESELPDLVDLLRVCVEAGLPPGRALGEVGRRHHGPLAREWRRTALELELGVPQREALRRLVRRCPPPAIAMLAAAVQRAERHGAPLSETLAAQAAEARADRARRIREQAAKAAPKIQLVVALLLVPSVMLLVVAALVAALVH
jgi:tight adherence protein C